MKNKITRLVFIFIKALVRIFYPKTEFIGAENIPEGPVIIVGNHAKMNAPIACELYFPGKHKTWTAGEMMHFKEIPAYSYRDFWGCKPDGIKCFFRILSYLITPLAYCIFNNADCTGVYHDSRILGTFRSSVGELRSGTRIVILPEHDVPHNNIICEFQENFVDVARMYYRKYKEAPSFVPMYTAPALKAVYFGGPIRFDPCAPASEERMRICTEMMDAVTDIARSLPEHTVVPYPNIPKREYPSNKSITKEFDSNGVSYSCAWTQEACTGL